MNSRDLKTLAFCWLRFGKKYSIIATEAGHWNADVLGVSDHESVEIEVKVSRADLRIDRNKPKHKCFGQVLGGRYQGPNRFYYLVPEVLKDSALAVAEELNPLYGVMVARADGSVGYHAHKLLTVARRARQLHAEKPTDALKDRIIKRMSSELAGWYLRASYEDRMIAAVCGLESNKDVEEPINE